MLWLEQIHAAQVCSNVSRHFLQLPIWNMALVWVHPKISISDYPLLAHYSNKVKVWHQWACDWDLQQLWTSASQVEFKRYHVDNDRTGHPGGGRRRSLCSLCPPVASAFGIIIIIETHQNLLFTKNNVRLCDKCFTSTSHESFKADIISLFIPNLHTGNWLNCVVSGFLMDLIAGGLAAPLWPSSGRQFVFGDRCQPYYQFQLSFLYLFPFCFIS